MYGRMVGTVGGATLEAVAAEPGAQISAAANALAEATQLNATNKQSARHVPARMDFICKVNTIGVYTLDVDTTNTFTTKKFFWRVHARCAQDKKDFTQSKYALERKCR